VHTAGVRARLDRFNVPFWLFVLLGTAGSLGTVLAAATVGANPRPHSYQWWLRVPEGNYVLAHVLFYSSIALLTLGWAGIGCHALTGRLTSVRSWTTLVLWGSPLIVGTPVFGRDVYSYIAQGELVRRGFNPYLSAPRVLGDGPLLSSIAHVWHNTTSPYGPLFVELTRIPVALSGSSLMFQVIAFRILEMAGVVLLMIALPVVARHFGADGGVALWLGVLSPLALFSAVASAHNDTLMLGLMASALAVGLRGSRRWAVVLFAVAATIKLPALAGVVFLYAGAWREGAARLRARLTLEAVVFTGVVIVAITELAGYGWTWVSPPALSIPTRLRVLTSPTVSVGVLLGAVAHAVSIHASTRSVVTLTRQVGEALGVIMVVLLALRCRAENATRYLGITLLIVVVSSPTVWPWYYLWGVTVLATTSAQRSRFLIAVAGLAMLLVGPGGSPMLGGNGFYVSGTIVVAGMIWFFASGQWRTVIGGVDHVV
jgi:hypothetical protein